MRESFVRALKWIILAFSLIMFFYQAQIAVNKYGNPPVVDTTDLLNIADIEPPLITICPKNQFSPKAWGNADNIHTKDLLLGKASKNNITAWGIHHNMTFEEWVQEIVFLDEDYPKLNFTIDDGPWMQPDYERRFYPMYGRCIEFSNYTITGVLRLKIFIDSYKIGSSPDAEVYLTDKKLRTRNTVHTLSHWGPKIIIENKRYLNYLVKVQQLSSFDPRNPDDCKEYTDDEFERCVDE